MRQMENLSKLGYEDLQPNTRTYSMVINAYAKSGEKGSMSKVEQLLAEMEQRSEKEKTLKPDTVTYNVVLNSLAKSGEFGAAQKAEAILLEMLQH